MYVTIDSVMLQVQRYLHVNRQKKENFCQNWQFFSRKQLSCNIWSNVQKFWTNPAAGGFRNVDWLGHLTGVNYENTQKFTKLKKKMALN
uniref:Uncharacterized protein n=1 Tax=Pyxicephalus adspersus TaxID=30357 RepID=A0AAV3AK84_PYXAD|nr:TPA: hypothetical protein GDO54_014329 [Pyxicephalus adspersus]